jgi:hypothetical protein
MARPRPRRELVQRRLEALTTDFSDYVDAYDGRVPFTTQQLRLHRQTIALRRNADGLGEAINSDDFLRTLRSTLQAWGLGGSPVQAGPGTRVRPCDPIGTSTARGA